VDKRSPTTTFARFSVTLFDVVPVTNKTQLAKSPSSPTALNETY